jgi:hypothetical protein
MKKILALVTVLALVAALILPMAVSAATGPAVPATPNVLITGNIATPIVTVTAPGDMNLGMFVGVGWTAPVFTPVTSGNVVITTNSYPDATATLTVDSMNYGAGYDYSAGRMYDGSRYMDYPIKMTVADTSNNPVGSGFVYIGNANNTVSAPAGAATFTSSVSDPKSFSYNLGATQYIDATDLAAGAGSYTIYVTVTATVNY